MEVSAQEGVEGEELPQDVGEEDEFTEEVEDDQVVTEPPPAAHTAGAGQAVLEAHRAACLVLPLTRQVPVGETGEALVLV